MPAEDRYLQTVEELEDRLAVMLGGRAAERVMFGTISTGAGDDIQRATELARKMVTKFGMSEKLGSVRYAGRQLEYLGGAPLDVEHLSPHTQDAIDGEVQRIVTEQYQRAQVLLVAHADISRSRRDTDFSDEMSGLDRTRNHVSELESSA